MGTDSAVVEDRPVVRVGFDPGSNTFETDVDPAEVEVEVYDRNTGRTLYGNACDCTDSRGWDVFEADGDSSEAWVQRCDNCGKFDTDDLAALQASKDTGCAVRWGLTENDRAEAVQRIFARPFLVGYARDGEPSDDDILEGIYQTILKNESGASQLEGIYELLARTGRKVP